MILTFSLVINCIPPLRYLKITPPEVIQAARVYVHKQHAKLAGSFDTFLSMSGPFNGLSTSSAEPAIWWGASVASGASVGLSDLAMNLAAAKSSSADLERVFSGISAVYGFPVGNPPPR